MSIKPVDPEGDELAVRFNVKDRAVVPIGNFVAIGSGFATGSYRVTVTSGGAILVPQAPRVVDLEPSGDSGGSFTYTQQSASKQLSTGLFITTFDVMRVTRLPGSAGAATNRGITDPPPDPSPP